MPTTATTTCTYGDALAINGGALDPIAAAGNNAGFGYGTSTCVTINTATSTNYAVSTNTPPIYSNVLTAGDGLIAFFLFVSLTLQVLALVIKSL